MEAAAGSAAADIAKLAAASVMLSKRSAGRRLTDYAASAAAASRTLRPPLGERDDKARVLRGDPFLGGLDDQL